MVITNWGMDENEVSLKKVLGRLKPKTSLKLVIISVESRKIQDPFYEIGPPVTLVLVLF